MGPQTVAFRPGAARKVIRAFASPLRAIRTYSSNRPMRQPVCPGRRVATSLDTVANGDRRLPRFPSLPLAAAKRWHVGAFPFACLPDARGPGALEVTTAVTDATAIHHTSLCERDGIPKRGANRRSSCRPLFARTACDPAPSLPFRPNGLSARKNRGPSEVPPDYLDGRVGSAGGRRGSPYGRAR